MNLQEVTYPKDWIKRQNKTVIDNLPPTPPSGEWIVLMHEKDANFVKFYKYATENNLRGFKIYKTGEFWALEIGKSKVKKQFGGWAISEGLFNWIVKNIKNGSTVLEFGSGSGTRELAKYFDMVSVEHDPRFVGKHHSTYIHATIIDGWYDVKAIKKWLPEDYRCVLVDGPPSYIGRHGFYDNLSMFKTDVPIIFDDVNREADREVFYKVAKKLGREYKIHTTPDSSKEFGVIL